MKFSERIGIIKAKDTIQIDSIDIEVDSIVQCVGTASDIDGDETNFSYEWLNPLGTIIATGGRLDFSTVSVSRDDTITCVATAFDSNGASTSDTASIVIINSAPELDNISVSPDSEITIGDSITCSATATDKNNDNINITYAWSNQNGTDLGSSEDLLLTVVNATNLDIITCTATVIDPIGATDSDEFSVIEEPGEDHATSEVPHEHSLEGLSVDRIRLRPARRLH